MWSMESFITSSCCIFLEVFRNLMSNESYKFLVGSSTAVPLVHSTVLGDPWATAFRSVRPVIRTKVHVKTIPLMRFSIGLHRCLCLEMSTKQNWLGYKCTAWTCHALQQWWHLIFSFPNWTEGLRLRLLTMSSCMKSSFQNNYDPATHKFVTKCSMCTV